MQTSSYPCPGCGAPADLTAGCRSCGRGPDPVAAEVIRLDAEISVLSGRVAQARRTYHELGTTLRAARQRRAELAARVRATRTTPPAVPAHAAPAPFGPAPIGPGQFRPGPVGPASVPVAPAGRPETSTRTVQGLLFVLGGLLLGTAAIVFTAVAWASVGIAGRAAILAGFTALALAVPPVAARRGLRGTAETFAAVGLLLVLLDGYAAWTVDLAGVTAWPGTRYAALTGGVSAAFAAGYGLVTRLAVPWFAALLVAQPVLPLLAVEARPGVDGWALVLTGVALVDLAVLAGLRRRPAPGSLGLAGRVAAWAGLALALASATVCATATLAVGEAAGTAYAAGLPLLAVGVVLLGATLVDGGPVLRTLAAAALVLLTTAAALRPVAALRPDELLVATALVTVAVAGVARLLPRAVRTGPRVGALVVAAGLAQTALLLTGGSAAATVARSTPPWQGAPAAPVASWGWQLPVAVLLAAGAGVLLLPRVVRFPLAVAAGVVTVFAAPAVAATPWPAVVALETVAGAALLLAAVRWPGWRGYRPVLVAAGGVLLVGHALLVGLAAPVGAGAVLAVVLVTALMVAARGRRSTTPARVLAGPAVAVAVLAVPALVAVTLVEVDPAPHWRLRGLAGAVGLLPVALAAVRRHWAELSGYAATALAVALPVAGFAPLVVPAGEPLSPYLAVAVATAVVGLAVVRSDVRLRVVGAGLAAATVVALVPAALQVLLGPYGWLTDVWSGVPAGVGLPPGPPAVRLSAGVALLVLLGAVAVAGRREVLGRPAALAVAVPLVGLTGPVLVAGLGVRWPALPAVSLLPGLAALLTAALARQVPRAGRLLPALAGTGLPLVGAGLAGLLPTRAGTLAGLGGTLVAAVVAGVAGRAGVRPLGWAGSAVVAVGFAVTAGEAGGLPLRTTAFAVLVAAVLALVAAAVVAVRRPVEGLVLDAAAHGVAVTALLLAVGSLRHAAAVCALWGAAVAVRALRPGESVGRRWALATSAGVSELVGAWLLLAVGQVALLEAYTLPAAGLAVLAGLVALRTRAGATSWPTLGPGLAAALLPSLVSVLFAPDPQPWRRLLLGAGALLAVLVGAVRRWQAPVVAGGVGLALLALHEAVRSWDLLPRWVFLAVGGLALIGLATTYERRRRDLARLRAVVGRLG
ncbi:hypothetical protein O7606_25205 [Micromonospora sp. WMMD882]|uniref:SCO7613 C-terminal domain-containing membrane protein n=1 Tax=Micromonospora sp. WMMD882 TaxID=3015151 RepID=UPI00248C719B|nr:hypothetical protein [Micromonospora sp. WMMD882]WBB79417.1 hypothetical protein O7606_25205 [Micromonospora sp. WMMD882]